MNERGQLDFLGGALRGLVDPLGRTLVLLLTPRGLQGASAAILTVVMELGRAAGPSPVVELMNSPLCHGRREQAFAFALIGWAACAPLYLFLLCSGARDHRRARHLAHDMHEPEASPPSMLA